MSLVSKNEQRDTGVEVGNATLEYVAYTIDAHGR